jgi:maltose alpha-D-glucosyltransferase/alpha-amylase
MKPEAFSVHYQRSLFSSITSLVRETYENLHRHKQLLPAEMQERQDRIIAYRSELLTTLKKIYAGKMEVSKIRIHGNYHLGQVLLTGKDMAISDYSGDPALSFSERRLRRSVFVDLASMIASFYEVAFDGFLQDQPIHSEDSLRLLPMAGYWAHYLCGFFIRAYKERAKGTVLIPSSAFDFETLLQYFVVQKAMTIFNAYLKKDPRRIIIAQTMLREVLPPQTEDVAVAAAAGSRDAAAGSVATPAETGTALKPASAETVTEPKPADIEAEKVEQH